MADPHILILKEWDQTEDLLLFVVFILLIDTNVGVVSL
jgi:hypothetical protein